jgi:hypothetical protein
MNALLLTGNASRSRTRSWPDADGVGGAGTLTAVGLELGLAEADGFALAELVGPDVVLELLPPVEHPAISNAAPLTKATANSGRTAA